MHRSKFLPIPLTLTFITLMLQAEDPVQKSYVIAGNKVDEATVLAELSRARQTYGVHPRSRKVLPLETLQAERMTVTLVRQSGPRILAKTDHNTHIVIHIRSGVTYPIHETVTLS